VSSAGTKSTRTSRLARPSARTRSTSTCDPRMACADPLKSETDPSALGLRELPRCHGRDPLSSPLGIGSPGSPCLRCAEGAHGARRRFTSEFVAAAASQAPGCCKHESSRRADAGGAAGCGQRQPRERRRPCAPRGQSRSSGTAPGAPDRRDRLVAEAITRPRAGGSPKRSRC
jgi:hypothetical protein